MTRHPRSPDTSRRLSRREALQVTGALAATGALTGCPFVRRLEPLCPDLIDPSAPDKRLAIDVHTHVFNASDLQVQNFITRVVMRQKTGGLAELAKFFGTVLQNVLWNTVPSGEQERRKLLEWSKTLKNCSQQDVSEQLQRWRTEGYRDARVALQTAARAVSPQVGPQSLDPTVPFRALQTPEQQGLRAIQELPESLEGFERQRASVDIEPARPSISAGLAFVFEQFQYRYVSALDFLNTYRSATRSIDLMMASLVDYDWWLNSGRPTATSLRDQIEVMASVAVATGGRVHAFVPFCPYREVAHRLQPTSTFSSLEFAQKAVEQRGALGVKLYPPMGFAALGNAQLSVWGSKGWLGPVAHSRDFGAQLDAAMRDLFHWCSQAQVPIMAHTSISNGADDDLEALAGFQYWKQALDEFPKLSVNFGHFGGVRTREASDNTDGFLRLFTHTAGSAGSRAFADSAYYAHLIDAPQALALQLRGLFERDAQGEQVLARRFMFGSDWKMLLLEAHSDRYFGAFEQLLADLSNTLGPPYGSLTDDVFARNAADFLMLHEGEPARERVQRFYAAEGLKQEPLWMRKLDQMA